MKMGLYERYADLTCCETKIREAIGLIGDCYQNGGKLLVCGNGGSASDSEHIVGELMKGFVRKRPVTGEVASRLHKRHGQEGMALAAKLQKGLPAISLTSQTSLITAIINDNGFEMMFAQQVFAYGRPGDVLIALSTSGNSTNVLNAAMVAGTLGMKTVGFTGRGGGKLAALADVLIDAPSDMTYEVQEYHIAIYHEICLAVEERFFVQ